MPRRPVAALLVAAVVLNACGWGLPVIRDYRGWQAFRVALAPLVPYEQFRVPGALLAVLAAGSALTNVVFVVAVIALASPRHGRPLARGVLVASAAAAVLDLHWPFSVGQHRGELALGYYLWIASFGALACAALADLKAWAARPPR